ncbi:Bifunctional adenosylcobalamin biosynthesis protein CobP [Roseovarius sp. THAF9]|uniref:bifunctional adenosylcobinamide kinase/adenosylcobinamide-phosphate guanylyltransferase n=1 Tax=Roseovarius sp. THAF9 TaxID=2587847 RepID=UPI0012691966|nr:bifunctional adenosylcobinamide kinase/adenosylcobinamide-phosphate guanylyltransferase [Roseovarius sp. THAF9]QFT91636.1 Bifunctional adenosylcobalamin biosynthesis protein CobP [Roseovarius sp. THAF9]
MLPGLSIVLGGIGSGKTIFAEDLVLGTGRTPVALVTTPPDDTGIQATLDRRQAAQAAWQTRHDPLDIGRTLAGISGDSAVLVDALPLWLANRAEAGHDLAEAEAELMAGLALCAAPVVMITRAPEISEDVTLRAARGRLNIKLAATAGLVVNVIAGLPQVLKGDLP